LQQQEAWLQSLQAVASEEITATWGQQRQQRNWRSTKQQQNNNNKQ